ncbi:MAG: phosphatase PAP2 family protein [Gemmatimonadetes bacterium]|nr:phosphatase PAP2 family protein [Gemmatimonadota bacterium]
MTSPPAVAAAEPAPVALSWRRWLVASLAAAVAAHLLDEWAWRVLRDARVYERDWGRLLRILGFLPTWGIVALALWQGGDDRAQGARRARLVLLAPLLGGLVAEVAKLLVRRLRPDPEQFGYAFRSFADGPWSNRGMGLPSSHTLVAFAGATALAMLFPRLRWLWYALAAGCALTRVMAVGHYLSDVVVAACLGWAVAQGVDLYMRKRYH